jgi:hypothetical protein
MGEKSELFFSLHSHGFGVFLCFWRESGRQFWLFFFFFYWLASPINSPLFIRGTPTYLFIGKLICYYFFLIAWPQTIKKIILVFYFFLVYF